VSADACAHPGWTTRAQVRVRVPAPEDVDPDVFLHVADLVGPVRVQP
jgi:hypothetical protein